VLPSKITIMPIEVGSGAVSWKVNGPLSFEGVPYFLDGTGRKETRRVDEALAGRVTRTSRCRSQKWWPREDAHISGQRIWQ